MPENPHDRLDRLREEIETTDGIDEHDRELLLRFDDRLSLQQYSAQRREKLLRHCKILAGGVSRESLGPDDTPDGRLADALEDETAARTIVRWINQTYQNEETNWDYRIALRVFATHVTDGDDIPDSVERDLQQYQNAENIAPRNPFIDLSTRGVRAVVERTAEAATEMTGDGDFRHVSSHDLRRRFAQRLLVDENMNPRVVMQVGGWSSFQAIEPYLNAPSEEVVDEEFSEVTVT